MRGVRPEEARPLAYPLRGPLYPILAFAARSDYSPAMPMLHGCAFPGCSTFTLSTYCIEHELMARALKESERAAHASPALEAEDVMLATAGADGTSELEPLGT
jgi:hypothetical protein